jgi:hypothetical protein
MLLLLTTSSHHGKIGQQKQQKKFNLALRTLHALQRYITKQWGLLARSRAAAGHNVTSATTKTAT